MKFIDFFSGAGGMRMGLERAGHTCVGFCEFDKYARKTYEAIFDTKGEWQSYDIRTTSTLELPKADLWCYGFPCQGISVAGKQKGIGTKANDTEADERSNLFFEIVRLLQGLSEENRPEWLLCENVKGLLSVDRGFGFARILTCLDEIGYDSEWQVFNTKNNYTVASNIVRGLPQNRERVYIISHFRKRCGRQIFPIARADGENNGEHQVDLKIVDDQGRLKKKLIPSDVCPTLRAQTHGNEPKVIDAIYNNRPARITKNAPTLRADRQGLCVTDEIRIRKLTCKEYFRLQGWCYLADDNTWNDSAYEKAKAVGVSDTQLYKQAGNGCSANITYVIGLALKQTERID